MSSKATQIRQLPKALSTSKEVAALTGEVMRPKLLSEPERSKRNPKPSSQLSQRNLTTSSAVFKTQRKAAMHKHFYHCLLVAKYLTLQEETSPRRPDSPEEHFGNSCQAS